MWQVEFLFLLVRRGCVVANLVHVRRTDHDLPGMDVQISELGHM